MASILNYFKVKLYGTTQDVTQEVQVKPTDERAEYQLSKRTPSPIHNKPIPSSPFSKTNALNASHGDGKSAPPVSVPRLNLRKNPFPTKSREKTNPNLKSRADLILEQFQPKRAIKLKSRRKKCKFVLDSVAHTSRYNSDEEDNDSNCGDLMPFTADDCDEMSNASADHGERNTPLVSPHNDKHESSHDSVSERSSPRHDVSFVEDTDNDEDSILSELKEDDDDYEAWSEYEEDGDVVNYDNDSDEDYDADSDHPPTPPVVRRSTARKQALNALAEKRQQLKNVNKPPLVHRDSHNIMHALDQTTPAPLLNKTQTLNRTTLAHSLASSLSSIGSQTMAILADRRDTTKYHRIVSSDIQETDQVLCGDNDDEKDTTPPTRAHDHVGKKFGAKTTLSVFMDVDLSPLDFCITVCNNATSETIVVDESARSFTLDGVEAAFDKYIHDDAIKALIAQQSTHWIQVSGLTASKPPNTPKNAQDSDCMTTDEKPTRKARRVSDYRLDILITHNKSPVASANISLFTRKIGALRNLIKGAPKRSKGQAKLTITDYSPVPPTHAQI